MSLNRLAVRGLTAAAFLAVFLAARALGAAEGAGGVGAATAVPASGSSEPPVSLGSSITSVT